MLLAVPVAFSLIAATVIAILLDRRDQPDDPAAAGDLGRRQPAAPRDPLLPPRRRPDDRRRDDRSPARVHERDSRAVSRRARDEQRRVGDVHVGDLRVGGGRHQRARPGPDPGHGKGRLLAGFRRRADRRREHRRPDHSAVDHVRDHRRANQPLGHAAVPRRRLPGLSLRRGDARHGVLDQPRARVPGAR